MMKLKKLSSVELIVLKKHTLLEIIMPKTFLIALYDLAWETFVASHNPASSVHS